MFSHTSGLEMLLIKDTVSSLARFWRACYFFSLKQFNKFIKYECISPQEIISFKYSVIYYTYCIDGAKERTL